MADIFTTVLNGIQKKFVDLGTHHAEVFVAVNQDGSAIGGGSTAGQAQEATQVEVRDRLPESLLASRLSVAVLGTPVLYAEGSATSAVSAAVSLGTTATMVSLQAETAGAAFAFGASGAAAQTAAQSTTGRIRIPAGASRDFMIPLGMTHVAWIRTGTTDGVASIVGLV